MCFRVLLEREGYLSGEMNSFIVLTGSLVRPCLLPDLEMGIFQAQLQQLMYCNKGKTSRNFQQHLPFQNRCRMCPHKAALRTGIFLYNFFTPDSLVTLFTDFYPSCFFQLQPKKWPSLLCKKTTTRVYANYTTYSMKVGEKN